MLWLVKVTARHVRVVLEARDRKQIVTICGLPDVDQIDEPLSMIPQITGADLHTPCRSVMKMARNAQRTLSPDRHQDLLGRLIGADELANAERHDVGILLAPQVVLGNLGAWDHQEIVEALGASRLGGDVLEVLLK